METYFRFHDRCSLNRCSRDSCSPATFAAEAQIKPQSKPKLTLCLALTHTYIVIFIYVLTLNQTRAYTLNYSESKCRWGASVRGAIVVLPYCNTSSAQCDLLKPCLNNGIYINKNTTSYGYICSCLSGFNGSYCELDR
jgi:hypothetical protein